jgi:hypothetical protein
MFEVLGHVPVHACLMGRHTRLAFLGLTDCFNDPLAAVLVVLYAWFGPAVSLHVTALRAAIRESV